METVIVYIVAAEDSSPKFPRYFSDCGTATEYAKTVGKSEGLHTWIESVAIPTKAPFAEVESVYLKNDSLYADDTSEE